MTTLLAARKAAFIFNYLRDNCCEITLSWDDGYEFVGAFWRAFPDRNGRESARETREGLSRAARRLYRACRELHEDGWLERWILANNELADPYHEPRWQHVYRLVLHGRRDLKLGRKTPWDLAARWSGIPAERIQRAELEERP